MRGPLPQPSPPGSAVVPGTTGREPENPATTPARQAQLEPKRSYPARRVHRHRDPDGPKGPNGRARHAFSRNCATPCGAAERGTQDQQASHTASAGAAGEMGWVIDSAPSRWGENRGTYSELWDVGKSFLAPACDAPAGPGAPVQDSHEDTKTRRGRAGRRVARGLRVFVRADSWSGLAARCALLASWRPCVSRSRPVALTLPLG